jgi:hypothetical protein
VHPLPLLPLGAHPVVGLLHLSAADVPALAAPLPVVRDPCRARLQ